MENAINYFDWHVADNNAECALRENGGKTWGLGRSRRLFFLLVVVNLIFGKAGGATDLFKHSLRQNSITRMVLILKAKSRSNYSVIFNVNTEEKQTIWQFCLSLLPSG